MTRRPLPVAAVALVVCALTLSACGGKGSSSKVPANAVAVVDGTPITRSQFDSLWKSTVKAYPAEGRKVPAPGTPEYKILRNQLLEGLVQGIVIEKKAEQDFGIKVTDSEVDAQLKQLKQQAFGGSEERYRQYLAAHDETDAQVRASIKSQLLSARVSDALGKKVQVSSGEIETYYRAHRAQYRGKPLAEVRNVVRQAVFQEKRNQAYGRWTLDARREFRSKIRYAKGFSAPPSANAG